MRQRLLKVRTLSVLSTYQLKLLTSAALLLYFFTKGEKTMAISAKKRRYSVSLTPAIVERFQSLCKQLGMPPSTMSGACEDALKTISEVFQMAKDKGSIELSDLYRLQGQQMELLESEEKERKNVPKQSGTAVRNGKNAR
jgi:hypothetical protein